MALTGKKQKFADAVLAGFSNREAAIRAGYAEASAGPAGSRLVKDADVVAYLQKKRVGVASERPKAASKPCAPKAAEKPASAPPLVNGESDPLEFLRGVMAGTIDANITQVKAATAMLPYSHKRLGETSKKEEKEQAATEAGKGKYAPRTGPRGAVQH